MARNLRPKRLFGAFVACLLLLAATPLRAAEERADVIGGVDVVVWIAPTPALERQPVVVFSHGMYMCPTQSRYLTRALADAGYIVIAPRHTDSNCKISMWFNLSRFGFKPSLWWNEEDYRDRADDVHRVVDGLADDTRYRGIADLDRLALVGHSLGGYTVLGLGGAWPSWRLSGVSAIIALTPYSLPFQRTEGLRRIGVPIMYQMGTLDPVFTLPLEAANGGYAQTPAPKYLIEIAGAAHLAWTDLGYSGRDAIVSYCVAFLDHYVKGAPPAAALSAQLPGAASFRFD